MKNVSPTNSPEPAATSSEEAFLRTMSSRTMLKSYILTIVKDSHLAEDTFQDTALVIARSWSKFDASLSFERWARGIARRTSLANLRKHKRLVLELDDDVLEALGSEFDSFENEETQEVQRQALKACMEQLSGKNRELVQKRYFENLSYTELASLFSRSTNALYVAFTRIHLALAGCMEKHRA